MKKYLNSNKEKKKFTDFGFQKIPYEEKDMRVKFVFDSVSKEYDLMNDLMSLGLHRLWKNALIDWLSPKSNQKLLDIAGGTGDVAYKFLKAGGGFVDILDINEKMIDIAKNKSKLRKFSHKINWLIASAENIPCADNTFERITISFGLRNIANKKKALDEIYRVLKPGGRFCCLEFSTLESDIFQSLFRLWSFKVLPKLGKIVLNDEKSYLYLAESISIFPNQNILSSMLSQSGFVQVKYRNLSGGIVSIHSGWKLD